LFDRFTPDGTAGSCSPAQTGLPCNGARKDRIHHPENCVDFNQAAGSSYDGQTRTVTGFWDHAVATGAQNAGSARGYVSKVPVSTLLPI